MDNTTQSRVDLRESLCNDRAVGTIQEISIPAAHITTLHAILFDMDPKILIPGNAIFPPAETPEEFYRGIQPILDRHPLTRFAEVRISGTGLHLILWLCPGVELMSEADQRRWGAIVKAVQRTLPIDPDMPGINAVTRPVGSINKKNGAVVTRLRAGEPVAPETVEKFVGSLGKSTFREIAAPLLGMERVHPCPVCQCDGSHLDVHDWTGMCYGSCGKITLERLFDAVYVPRPTNKKPRGKKAKPEKDSNESSLEGAGDDPLGCEEHERGATAAIAPNSLTVDL